MVGRRRGSAPMGQNRNMAPHVASRHTGPAIALATTALLVAGCAGWTTNPELTLDVDNAIDRPLLVYVNDDWVGTIPAGTTDAAVPASGHGGPPWAAEKVGFALGPGSSDEVIRAEMRLA